MKLLCPMQIFIFERKEKTQGLDDDEQGIAGKRKREGEQLCRMWRRRPQQKVM